MEVDRASTEKITFINGSGKDNQMKEIRAVKKKIALNSPELNKFLDSNSELNKTFKTFSMAKQRKFAEYINEANKPETKQKRLETIGPMILEDKV
jgi:uncharacterized protein YdeI (YjbR/CyaY-like superfamily)